MANERRAGEINVLDITFKTAATRRGRLMNDREKLQGFKVVGSTCASCGTYRLLSSTELFAAKESVGQLRFSLTD